MPPRDVFVGQDLIRHQLQLNRQVGSMSEGHSTELMLCIVAPRLIPKESDRLTRDLQRLNADVPASRAVRSLGLAAVAVDTMMVDPSVSESVARAALGVADRLR